MSEANELSDRDTRHLAPRHIDTPFLETAIVKKFLRSTLALTLLLAGAAVGAPQAAKPVLVISIPSYNDILANVDFLGKLAGQPAAAQQMDQMVGLFAQGLKGLDRTRPIGVVVSSEGADFTPLAFVPTTNLKDLMQCLPQLPRKRMPADSKSCRPWANRSSESKTVGRSSRNRKTQPCRPIPCSGWGA